MLFKMEANRNENEQNSELGGACRWDACALGQGVSNEGDRLLAKGQDMGPVPSKLDGSESAEETVYYAVSVPIDSCEGESDETLHVYNDRSEAMKVMKKYKKARFKSFKLREEAVEFAVQGPETIVISSYGLAENSEAAIGIVGEKPSPFKGPKAQDLVRLRKMIECGDIDTFTGTVWDNPRYLVSSGDTPAILQEGSRYNALHVAAKARNAEICSLVLQTVGNVAFIQLLYGDDDDASCKDRAGILVDLYLNTPDKALNETPLHFAVKFGSRSVVDVLVSYPQCDKNAKNKFGQVPRDVICSRVSSPEAGLRRDLENLLDDRFYVPVLRSEDNSVQAAVGDPFSPACPLVLKADPVSPRMEIRAYAGPMDFERAQTFRRRWKTPPRVSRTINRNSNVQARTRSPNRHSFRLLDVEKGLERVGRDLAQEFKVDWNEYWPFLDTFTNLASQDGLQKLEDYLEKRFLEAWQQQNNCDVSNTGLERYDNIKHGCATASPESSESQSRDSDQQCGGEMAHSTCDELMDDQQRPCGSGRQTSDIANVNQSCEVRDVSSESCAVHKLSESDDTMDSEEFYTPPSSPEKLGNASLSSCGGGGDDDDEGDGDMSTAEEGPIVFIQGDSPSRLDITVMQALDGSNIQPTQYPNIYRWRHSVLLHPEHERATWPSPFCSRPKEQTRILRSPDAASAQCQRNVQPSTPPQAWYKITGPYSPLRSRPYEGNVDPVSKYSSKIG